MKMVVYSQLDPAGKNIAGHLRTLMPFVEVPSAVSASGSWKSGDCLMVETSQRLIELDIDTQSAQWVLCLSRHKSESGKRCLTVHSPGNLTTHADLGGAPSSVGISNPGLQARLLTGLASEKNRAGISEEVTVEATHHGPTSLTCPITFVEIGSNEDAWQDPALGRCVARSVVQALALDWESPPNALGVGGGHYSEKFTTLMVDGRYSIGHIIPKYALVGGMALDMYATCADRTRGGISAIVVDWKGTPSAHKEHLKAFTSSRSIELVHI